jgi:hypothetical protein
MHHGLVPSATILSDSAISSSHVVGPVPLGLEGLDRVPDGRLHVGLVGDAPDVRALCDQADRGRMLIAELLGIHERRHVLDLACGGVGQDGRRLGEHRQVRRLAAVDARLEHGLVARADAVDLDLDTRRRRKVRDCGSEVGAFAADPLGLDETVLPPNSLSAPSAWSARRSRWDRRNGCRCGRGRCDRSAERAGVAPRRRVDAPVWRRWCRRRCSACGDQHHDDDRQGGRCS